MVSPCGSSLGGVLYLMEGAVWWLNVTHSDAGYISRAPDESFIQNLLHSRVCFGLNFNIMFSCLTKSQGKIACRT